MRKIRFLIYMFEIWIFVLQTAQKNTITHVKYFAVLMYMKWYRKMRVKGCKLISQTVYTVKHAILWIPTRFLTGFPPKAAMVLAGLIYSIISKFCSQKA